MRVLPGPRRRSASARRGETGPVILLYHRITEGAPDPYQLSVSPSHFAEHLEWLRRRAQVITLTALRRGLDSGRLSPTGVVITFDDGYADNVQVAKPLLERHDVPATVFVTTGYLGGRREFWWDELERVLLEPVTLPATLHLRIAGVEHRWTLADPPPAPDVATGAAADRLAPRRRLLEELHRLLRPLPDGARRLALDHLQAWAGAGASARERHRPLTDDELGRLAAGGLIEVGAHTVSHSVLAALDPETQEAEIAGSRDDLECRVGRPVTSFSYPYGTRADYTPDSVAAVRRARLSVACTTHGGPVRPDTSPFELPRLMVFDWSGDEFARRLDGVFGR